MSILPYWMKGSLRLSRVLAIPEGEHAPRFTAVLRVDRTLDDVGGIGNLDFPKLLGRDKNKCP